VGCSEDGLWYKTRMVCACFVKAAEDPFNDGGCMQCKGHSMMEWHTEGGGYLWCGVHDIWRGCGVHDIWRRCGVHDIWRRCGVHDIWRRCGVHDIWRRCGVHDIWRRCGVHDIWRRCGFMTYEGYLH
jgi:hypothetical protein